MRLKRGMAFGLLLGVLLYRVGTNPCPLNWLLLVGLAIFHLVGSRP